MKNRDWKNYLPNKWCAFFAIGMACGQLWAQDLGTDGVQTSLRWQDLEVVATGEKVYQTHCAACHGKYLQGQTNWQQRDAEGYLPAPPHDETGHTWHHRDDLLFEITKYGASIVIGDRNYKTRMPAYQGILSDDEIVAVLSFIKNQWPARERNHQDSLNSDDPNAFTAPSREDNSTLLDKLKTGD